MAERLGQQLQEWRLNRGFSLRQLAERAQVGKSTLDNWERSAFEPRLPELEATLSALAVSSEEREQVLALMKSRRGMAALREAQNAAYRAEELGPMPHGGALLRALRHRKHWQLEQVATALRVSPSTLSRWEQGKIMPTPEQLGALLTALGALPQDRAALRAPERWKGAQPGESAHAVETLRERFTAFLPTIYRHSSASYCDLGFLAFEAEVWPLAARQTSGQHLLMEIYAYHASYLNVYDRNQEAGSLALRALNLSGAAREHSHWKVRAALAAAHSHVYSFRSFAPERRPANAAVRQGIELLERWHPLVNIPALEGWLLQDMAYYVCWTGDRERALALAERAYRAAERSGNPDEVTFRSRDMVKVLLGVGQIDAALTLLTTLTPSQTYPEISLLWVEGMLAAGEATVAERWLRQAHVEIETSDQVHLRRRAAALQHRLNLYAR